MQREVEFRSGGESCRGTLFLPGVAGADCRVPCIVMGHGLGATRALRLSAYAQRFTDAGFAALSFDYRNFGDSAGEPRQVLSIPGQLEDWAAAIAFARNEPALDAGRIGLWGTSFGGGHALVAAARDGHVQALCCQCPMLDGRAASLAVARSAGLAYGVRMLGLGLRDRLGALLGRPPILMPIIGHPGQLAAMSTPDAEAGYRALAPEGIDDRVAARIAVDIGGYRPIASARLVKCPALIQICDQDSVAPPSAAKAAARRLGSKAEVLQYSCGHFEIYLGELFERAVADQLAFFQRNL